MDMSALRISAPCWIAGLLGSKADAPTLESSAQPRIPERFADSCAAIAHLSAFGEKFAQRFLAAVDPTRLSAYGTPSDEVRQALAAFSPAYLSPLGGFARAG
jgi:hypothetical protein